MKEEPYTMASKTEDKKADIVVAPPANDQLPDYLRDQSFKPEDNFGSEDVFIPRIKLLQGLSPEIGSFPEAKVGDFWHGGADVSLGTSFAFVIGDRRKKYLLSTPIADGQGVLARADDAMHWDRLGTWQVKLKDVKKPVTWTIADLSVEKSGLAGWGSGNPEDPDSTPAATLFYDYLVMCVDQPDLGPAVISLARSSIRKAKRELNPKIKLHLDAGRPMQALKFIASSVDDMANNQPYKNWSFRASGFVGKELFDQMRQYRGALANFKVQDEAAPETDASGTGDTGEGNF